MIPEPIKWYGSDDSITGISPLEPAGGPPFRHCVAGLHIGKMTPRPVEGEFDSVLTVAREAGHVPDLVRHRHTPLTYAVLPAEHLHDVVVWTESQLVEDRKILIRSEGGRQRPGLIVGAIIIRMGGSYADALTCVRRADPGALTDFRYLDLLRSLDQALNRSAP